VNTSHTVSVRYAKAVSAPVFDLLPVTRLASLPASVSVPVFAGQKLGVVRVLQDAMVVATVDAVAATPKASAEETVGAVPVDGAPGLTVVAKTAACSLPVAAYDVKRPVERLVSLCSTLTAPVAAGAPLGTVQYRQDGRSLVVVPVVAAAAVPAP